MSQYSYRWYRCPLLEDPSTLGGREMRITVVISVCFCECHCHLADVEYTHLLTRRTDVADVADGWIWDLQRTAAPHRSYGPRLTTRSVILHFDIICSSSPSDHAERAAHIIAGTFADTAADAQVSQRADITRNNVYSKFQRG